jgi:hypothetical protein
MIEEPTEYVCHFCGHTEIKELDFSNPTGHEYFDAWDMEHGENEGDDYER